MCTNVVHLLPITDSRVDPLFQTFYTLLTQILYPMSPVTLNASIFMTLALTVERYLAVCMPIRYR